MIGYTIDDAQPDVQELHPIDEVSNIYTLDKPNEPTEPNSFMISQFTDVVDYRRENLKRYVVTHGGAKNVAIKLEHTNSSFLVQMIGPNPTRPISEKSARKFEGKLELPLGYLDTPVKNCRHVDIPLVKFPYKPKMKKPKEITAAQFDHDQSNEADDMITSKSAMNMTTTMKMVHEMCMEHDIDISVQKFITLVQQALLLSASNNGQVTKDDLIPLIELLKN